jgi:hypothetical protein
MPRRRRTRARDMRALRRCEWLDLMRTHPPGPSLRSRRRLHLFTFREMRASALKLFSTDARAPAKFARKRKEDRASPRVQSRGDPHVTRVYPVGNKIYGAVLEQSCVHRARAPAPVFPWLRAAPKQDRRSRYARPAAMRAVESDACTPSRPIPPLSPQAPRLHLPRGARERAPHTPKLVLTDARAPVRLAQKRREDRASPRL